VHPREARTEAVHADDVVFTYSIMMHPRTITPLKCLRVHREDREDRRLQGGMHAQATILTRWPKFSFKIIPRHGRRTREFLTREDPSSATRSAPARTAQDVTGDGEVVRSANPDYFKGRAHIDKSSPSPSPTRTSGQALMFNAVE